MESCRNYHDLLRKYYDVCRYYGEEGERIINRNKNLLDIIKNRIINITYSQNKNIEFIQECFSCPPGYATKIDFNFDFILKNMSKEFFRMLCPHKTRGLPISRVGGPHDGGYMMVSPKDLECEAALSLGVSDFSPWDLEIAQIGVPVHQWDGSISDAPDKHYNLFFHPFNVTGECPLTQEKSFSQVISDSDCRSRKNVLLQMDIEGHEWGIIDAIMKNKNIFNQIIIEFHNINIFDISDYNIKKNIICKLLQFYDPIAIHSNNYCNYCFFDDLSFAPDIFELTLLRKGLCSDQLNIDNSFYIYPNYDKLPDPHFIF